MASTTNYSWTTPDDTSLVKDGAAAIRSLGSAIDSTVFTNAGAAISKTIVDAKGDLIAATAADTLTRLAVGTNGQTLLADSTTATGLRWGSPAGGKVLQVIHATSSTQTSTTSSTYADTGLTATITPTATTSRIVIMLSGVIESGSNANGGLRIVRGATSIYAWDWFDTHGTITLGAGVAMTYLDSPSTTSATTYKLQLATLAGTFRWAAGSLASSIILMEIGA